MPAEHELCLVCSTWGWLLNDKEWVESPEEHEKEVLRAGKRGEFNRVNCGEAWERLCREHVTDPLTWCPCPFPVGALCV